MENRLGLFTSVARVVAELVVIVVGLVMLFLMPAAFMQAAAHFDLSLGTYAAWGLSILLSVGFAALIFSAFYGMPQLAILASGLVLLFLILALYKPAAEYFGISQGSDSIWIQSILLGVGFVALLFSAFCGIRAAFKKGLVVFGRVVAGAIEISAELFLMAISYGVFFLVSKLLKYFGFGDFSQLNFDLKLLLGLAAIVLVVAAIVGVNVLWKKIRQDPADEKQEQPDGDGAVRRG